MPSGSAANDGIPVFSHSMGVWVHGIYMRGFDSMGQVSCARSDRLNLQEIRTRSKPFFAFSAPPRVSLENFAPSSKGFLTTFRGYLTMGTCFAILAVDFPIFPREYAKTESFGISLVGINRSFLLPSSHSLYEDGHWGWHVCTITCPHFSNPGLFFVSFPLDPNGTHVCIGIY